MPPAPAQTASRERARPAPFVRTRPAVARTRGLPARCRTVPVAGMAEDSEGGLPGPGAGLDSCPISGQGSAVTGPGTQASMLGATVKFGQPLLSHLPPASAGQAQQDWLG